MRHGKFLLFYAGIIFLSVIVIRYFYNDIQPMAAVNLPLDRSEIVDRAYELADKFNLDTENMYATARLRRNRSLIRQLQSEKGLSGSNQALREDIPGYFWQLSWHKDDAEVPPDDLPNNPPNRRHSTGDKKPPRWDMDIHGNLLKFSWPVGDSLNTQRLELTTAREVAGEFLKSYTPYNSILTTPLRELDLGPSEEITEDISDAKDDDNNITLHYSPGAGWSYRDGRQVTRSDRTDYEFFWRTFDTSSGDSIDINVTVAGDEISAFESKHIIPKTFESDGGKTPIIQILGALMYILLGIITIVMAFQRWRSYEVSFQLALSIGTIVTILFILYFYQTLWDQNMGMIILIPMILAPLINGGIFIFIWAVGESIGREVWPRKFITLDLIRNGYWLHSRIGKGIIRGIGIGILAAAINGTILYLVNQYLPLINIPEDQRALEYINSISPFAHFLGLHGFSSLFSVATFMVLLLSVLRKRINYRLILLLIPAIALVILYDNAIEPVWLGLTVNTLTMMLSVWAFYRFDILTAFWAMFTAMSVEPVGSLFVMGNSGALVSGILTAAFWLAAIAYGSATLLTRDRISDFRRIVPAFAKNISERQRLQRELEIAHRVQMSFLPAKNPDFIDLDIAAQCIPALEVGGDYYDFVELDDKRLGIVVGDVSGKGTQAAFYMTLTKGFWRALADADASPANVLTQLNKLFYDNVKRGVFISMVYGVFDMEKGTLTMARAGHNPVVMHRSLEKKMDMINPRGLALGMEKGEKFGHMIQEVTIPLRPDDLFVFYTDGFTEAMDKNRQEYGETRFEQVIERNAGSSADGVMQGIFKDVKQFAGRAQQHDDMTIVVVKVSEKELSGSIGHNALGEALGQ